MSRARLGARPLPRPRVPRREAGLHHDVGHVTAGDQEAPELALVAIKATESRNS
jgi:hypothetical protein